MGIFTKPTTTDINKVLPFIMDPPDSLVWSITDTTDGVDTVSVQGYANDELLDAYDEFLEAAATPKIFRYAPEADKHNFPNIDYIRGLDIRLAPKRVFVDGVLTEVHFYANVSFDAYGQEVFDDMVVCENYAYTRNSDGFAIARTLTIEWMTEAETKHPTAKTRYKTYSLTESIRETDRRRGNVLDELKSSMIGLFVAAMGMTTSEAITAGQTFFEHHLTDILVFKDIGDVTGLIDAINADTTHAWLDNVVAAPSTTMRQFITGTLASAILVGT